MQVLLCFVLSLVVCGALCSESPKNGRSKRYAFGGDRFGPNWGIDARISPDMGRVYYPGTPGGPQKLGWEESRSVSWQNKSGTHDSVPPTGVVPQTSIKPSDRQLSNGWYAEQQMQGSYRNPPRWGQEYGSGGGYPQSWFYNPPQQTYGYNYHPQGQMQSYNYQMRPQGPMGQMQPYSGMYSAWNSPSYQNILRQEIPQASQQWYPGGGQQYWGSYQNQPPRQNWYPPTRQW